MNAAATIRAVSHPSDPDIDDPAPRAGDAAPHAPFAFALEATSGRARAGTFQTPHGPVQTPAFMPVGTHGALKAMTPDAGRRHPGRGRAGEYLSPGLRPGEALVEKLGGLHEFMQWPGPILTDSGGFQVFSLPGVEITDKARASRTR